MTTQAKALIGVVIAGVVALSILLTVAAVDAWSGGMHDDNRGGHMDMMAGSEHGQMTNHMGGVMGDGTLTQMQKHMADHEPMMSVDEMMDHMMSSGHSNHHPGAMR